MKLSNYLMLIFFFQICDYNLRILNINASFPGSCHDAYIWRNSVVQEELRACHQAGDHNSWLLGDSGYPQQPWLMTPILNAQQGSPQERYNSRHASARNCVERCIGVLKARFRCILGERKLRYSPDKVGNVAIACAVLHNLCVAGHLEMPEPQQGNPEQLLPVDFHNNDIHLLNDNTRNRLIQQYF